MAGNSMRILKAFFWLFLLAAGASAQAIGLKVCETDGSPCKTGIKEIYVSPGTLTITGQRATIAISGGGGSGDVVGPASSTDNAVARFDLATGKLLQNSVVLIGDTGAVTGVAALTISGVLTAGSGPTTVTDSAGKILSAALNTVQPAQGGTGITALGTGIATALGVNVGSAGAPVLFNGAGGTPSGITLTNGTGLPPTTGIVGWPANAAGDLSNNGSGTLSWVARANAALSNLASVSVNASLIPQTTLDLGAAATAWRNLYIYGGGTFGSHSIKFDGTPTGNRTATFPDNTGTVAELNLAQTFSAAQTFSGQIISSLNGAVSTPPITATGTWFTGGSATTTKPQVLIEPSGTTTTGWSTSGTGLGVNAATGFTGNLIDLQLTGTQKFAVSSTGLTQSTKNGGYAVGIQASGQNFVGIGRNASIGGLNLNGGTGTDSDSAAMMHVSTTGVTFDATFAVGWASSNVTQAKDTNLQRPGQAATVRVQGSSSTTAATLSTPALSPAQITADQNNYNPGTGWFQRWSSDASRNITGLVAGVDGQIIEIWNIGSQNIVLQNENASSTAANRFTTSTGADLTLAANKCAKARYDTTSARWRAYLCN